MIPQDPAIANSEPDLVTIASEVNMKPLKLKKPEQLSWLEAV